MSLEGIRGEAQVDFGKAHFYDGNVRRQGCYLNISFPHSNAGYLQLLRGENMQFLAEGLMNVFAHVGGALTGLWLDNASAAVKRVFEDGYRELAEEFLRFEHHYGFNTTFCNLGY